MSPTPATIQRNNNNAQPQAALPPNEGRRAHGKDIAKYLRVGRATLYRYLTEDTAA